MIPEILSAIKGIKVSVDIVKGLNNLKNDYEIKLATSDLLDSIINVQNDLLAIQSSYQTLLDSKGEIEKELMKLKDWETEKLNYSLKQISPGVFVYIMKETQDSPDKQYWLCTNCFDTKNIKSILQRRFATGDDVTCHSCKTNLKLPEKGESTSRIRFGV